ncbi:hypothetical protein B0H67DRAFT_648897 [Lasiosphaeris hirsuta]|uniref:Heterokaryon incompatibility domain-containing protein n=1 Tax=Lasiosphaeris hirsuta TaxID=260670 RepID=A0AA39ZVG4_9PEZI|nr:hypothetical protein B0H67DRAFT_648897 [Lasiosphaeris hirsuta]
MQPDSEVWEGKGGLSTIGKSLPAFPVQLLLRSAFQAFSDACYPASFDEQSTSTSLQNLDIWHRKKKKSRTDGGAVPRRLLRRDVPTKPGLGNPCASQSSGSASSNQFRDYTDISPWQARLIALSPSPDRKVTLKAKLLVVDLVASEGAVIASSKRKINYDALSYCWACPGSTKKPTRSTLLDRPWFRRTWICQEPSITVDYTKSLSEIYQDAATYMFQTGTIDEALHFRKPGSRSLSDLPSWALDWQRDSCSPTETEAIYVALSRHSIERFGHIITWCPLSPNLRKTYIKPTAWDAKANNINLNELKTHFLAPPDKRRWKSPRPVGDGTLELFGRVLKYVAELTDYACDLDWLTGDDDSAMALYSRALLGGAYERLAKCKQKRAFDPDRDRRRLAVLRTPVNTHLALVPADTRKGDLLVAVDPGVLPLVLSPLARSSPGAEDVYLGAEGVAVSKASSVFKGEGRYGVAIEDAKEQRRRLEGDTEVFGKHFKIRELAFAQQGFDFYTEDKGGLFYFNDLRVEKN